jgi:hypothetical protein
MSRLGGSCRPQPVLNSEKVLGKIIWHFAVIKPLIFYKQRRNSNRDWNEVFPRRAKTTWSRRACIQKLRPLKSPNRSRLWPRHTSRIISSSFFTFCIPLRFVPLVFRLLSLGLLGSCGGNYSAIYHNTHVP